MSMGEAIGRRPSNLRPRARAGPASASAFAVHDRLGAPAPSSTTRSIPAYRLNPPPRTNPASVRPKRRARSIARLDGAETAASSGAPAATHFWASSYDARPLTHTSVSARGTRSSSSAQPSTLSRALWRPTSSRSARSVPSRSKRPAACSPPVRSKSGWAARRRSGSAAMTDARIGAPFGSGRQPWSVSASSCPLPHTPHDAVAAKCRSSAAVGARALSARSTFTTLYCWASSTSVQ